MRCLEWVAFALLCVWSASQWLLTPEGDALPGLERQGLGFAVVAVVAFAVGALRRPRGVGQWRLLGGVAGISLLFFAVPAVLVERAREYAPETSVAAVFALVPVVVVLASNAIQREGRGVRLLVPALAGFGGLLFLLPFEMPISLRGWESVAELVVAMLLVACVGVWLYGRMREVPAVGALAVVGAANAVALVVWCAARGSFDWRWEDAARGASIGWVGGMIATALTVWLLRAVEPVRFSARFLVIPLVTIVEGLALLRPEVTGRTVVGVALLAAGAGWMLVADERVEDEVLTLR